ncbi:MAG: hypothetical protein C0506_09570 [Anaerolinea sp.]|nr:hypothetical protein [Anaerolinea sp.]
MIRFLFGRTAGRLLSLAVIAAVALGAFWFFAIREDNDAQKEAAAVTEEVRKAANATPTAAVNTPAAGTARPATAAVTQAVAAASTIGSASYSIVQGQSSAWYLAPEKLASLPTSSVAKGTTNDVKGEFHFTADGLDAAKPTTFTVGLASLKSNESRRDQRAQGALETSRFPTATFTATKLTGMPKEFNATDALMQLTGILDLHGVKREVTWELKVKKDGDILSGLGTTKFKYSDFGINKPDIAGFVTVEPEVTIQVQLFAKQG